MSYINYNDRDVLSTITKTTVGQAVDIISPHAGLAYHVITTVTAQNPIDLTLGILGILGSK